MGFIAVDVHNCNGDSTHRIGCSVFAETIHPIDQKYLPGEIIDCDTLQCKTLEGATIGSINFLFGYLLGASILQDGAAMVISFIDVNGAFRRNMLGKQSATLKITIGDAVVHVGVTMISNVNGNLDQIAGYAILFDNDYYFSVNYNFTCSADSNETTFMLQATPTQPISITP